MIQANAKCVVNGKKVNEIAGWLNQFINLTEEEIDIVDAGNTPGKRWFLTGKLAGDLGAGSAEDGDRNNLGGTSGNSQGSVGGGNSREQLSTGGRPLAPGSSVGAAVDIRSGVNSAGIDTGKSGVAADSRRGVNSAGIDTGVDQFGNTIGGAGRPVADGSTAADSRAKFLAAKQGETTTPPPLPGAPPLGGDTTPPPLPGAPPPNQPTTPPPTPGAPPPNQPTTSTQADTAPSTQADEATAKRWATYLESKEDLVYSLSKQLREAKKNDTQRWDENQNMWVFKKSGDPDSELVQALEARLEVAKAELKKAQSKA